MAEKTYEQLKADLIKEYDELVKAGTYKELTDYLERKGTTPDELAEICIRNNETMTSLLMGNRLDLQYDSDKENF